MYFCRDSNTGIEVLISMEDVEDFDYLDDGGTYVWLTDGTEGELSWVSDLIHQEAVQEPEINPCTHWKNVDELLEELDNPGQEEQEWKGEFPKSLENFNK